MTGKRKPPRKLDCVEFATVQWMLLEHHREGLTRDALKAQLAKLRAKRLRDLTPAKAGKLLDWCAR